MGKATEPPAGGGDIEPIDLEAALEERYLAYALSTIMGRAVPDVPIRLTCTQEEDAKVAGKWVTSETERWVDTHTSKVSSL